ncbi:MAG: hypothetical protein ACK4ZD_08550 [Caldimonas sp.]|uniref:hypothetical protein n=1 Tax=Caldimonas sp. TaxID=2838790 RepID=UPI0039188FC6
MNPPTVFVHTNDQQMLGALLAAYSFRSRSASPERFEVKLLRLEDTPHLHRREGQRYLRMGKLAVWHNDDLQSFSPLRRLVPQLMGYQGRALVTDPDVFSAGGDVYELLTCDMQGKAVMCRNLPASQGGGPGKWATSVMLLDCARLTDWRWDEEIDAMFSGRLDYKPWIQLAHQDPSTIGELPEEWNSFDKLTPQTRLLHMTERLTQPWKTGLPVDFNTNFQGLAGRLRRWLRDRGLLRPRRRYLPHPDPHQEAFFFDLLREGLEKGVLTEDFLRQAVASQDVRPDVFERLGRAGYRGCPR